MSRGKPKGAVLAEHELAIVDYVLGRSRGRQFVDTRMLRKAVEICESTMRQLAVDHAHTRDVADLHAMLTILRSALERETTT